MVPLDSCLTVRRSAPTAPMGLSATDCTIWSNALVSAMILLSSRVLKIVMING